MERGELSKGSATDDALLTLETHGDPLVQA